MGSCKAPDESSKQLGSFGQEFVGAVNTALNRYPKHADDDITNHIDVVEFNYNGFFDKIRKKMQQDAAMRSRLNAVAALAGGPFVESLVGKLVAWEEEFADDDFFYTHWLDVIFYSTFIGGKIRVDLARKINDLVKLGNRNLHIIAHSLGTAVVFDTLNLLYRPEHDPNDEIPDLSSENDRIASLWMIANVSRLLGAVTGLADPLSASTTVKPGDGGCTSVFYNIRHKLDPITWPAQFDPDNDGNWITTQTYQLCYSPIVTELVVDPNTHSFFQYVQDPNVAVPLLSVLLRSKFRPTEKQLNDAAGQHAGTAIEGAFSRLRSAFAGIEITDSGSIDDLLEAAATLRDAIASITANL